MTDSGVRLADLVGAFSLATDLGLGQPMDHAAAGPDWDTLRALAEVTAARAVVTS